MNLAAITQPSVTAQMLIRKPIQEVFEAFCDPEITRQFWFTHSSGRVASGARLLWRWETYGVETDVIVLDFSAEEYFTIEWSEPRNKVLFAFSKQGDEATYVAITSFDFPQEGDELIQALTDNMGGFTTVLDGLKCWLEHGLSLNLIADKFAKH